MSVSSLFINGCVSSLPPFFLRCFLNCSADKPFIIRVMMATDTVASLRSVVPSVILTCSMYPLLYAKEHTASTRALTLTDTAGPPAGSHDDTEGP